MTTVERCVPFSTVFNFRDLGGYRTVDSRTVRWGRMYRSDGLFRLAAADLDSFARLGVRSVLDLRRPDELATDGRIAESLDLAYHHVNFHGSLWPPHEPGTDGMARYLADRYAEMADDSPHGTVGTALRLLADACGAPLVFHCAAGKDRTGVLAAVTLALLGVDDDQIADDYALSADSERRYWDWVRTQPNGDLGGHAPVDPCPRAAMQLFLAELRDRHGSVDAYARRAGVTDAEVAALRAHLLD